MSSQAPPDSPQSQRTVRSWTKAEVERLVIWMEANQECVRGKQSAWHKEVKEQVFADADHITVKRIREKAVNMRSGWKHARAYRERSGWGHTQEENQQANNQTLERRCPFFWRLDDIWGSYPMSARIPSARSRSAVPQRLSGETVSPVDEVSANNFAQAPSTKDPSNVQDLPDSESELEWAPDPPQITGSAPRPAASFSPIFYPPPKREPREKAGVIKRLLEDRQALQNDKTAKRLKAEQELQRERLEAEERRFERELEAKERIAQIQANVTRDVARIQAEAQTKQFEALAQIVSMVSGLKQTRATPFPPTPAPPPTTIPTAPPTVPVATQKQPLTGFTNPEKGPSSTLPSP